VKNLTEIIKLSTEISQQLFTCVSKDEIEKVFSTNRISKIPDKIGLLRLCMGVKSYSPSPSVNELTLEQQYEDELLVFLDGSWRFLV
jgi:hypothetical protein